MYYRFPKITLPGDERDAALKCIEELMEFRGTFVDNEGEARELEEFCDAWQSMETLHRRMVAKHGPLAVELAADGVVAKNMKRGYYGQSNQHQEVRTSEAE